jgi:hypothetical protein
MEEVVPVERIGRARVRQDGGVQAHSTRCREHATQPDEDSGEANSGDKQDENDTQVLWNNDLEVAFADLQLYEGSGEANSDSEQDENDKQVLWNNDLETAFAELQL